MPRISQVEQMLMGALNDLDKDWQAARVNWRDEARRHFEDDFIREIGPAVRMASTSASSLTTLLKRVVKECS